MSLFNLHVCGLSVVRTGQNGDAMAPTVIAMVMVTLASGRALVNQSNFQTHGLLLRLWIAVAWAGFATCIRVSLTTGSMAAIATTTRSRELDAKHQRQAQAFHVE